MLAPQRGHRLVSGYWLLGRLSYERRIHLAKHSLDESLDASGSGGIVVLCRVVSSLGNIGRCAKLVSTKDGAYSKPGGEGSGEVS